MLTEERYNKILEALKNKGTITVAEMTECTGASESTIRRDLIALDEMGKLNKVHGGATAVAHQFIADEIAVSVKEQLCVEEKKAIARYAVNMINDDDFIFIDAGTSTGWMIEYLESTRATFVTNGIAHLHIIYSICTNRRFCDRLSESSDHVCPKSFVHQPFDMCNSVCDKCRSG